MRKTILVTAAIAFVALGMALGVAKSDQIKAFFSSEELYNKETAATEMPTTEETAATDTTAATDETAAAETTETVATAEEQTNAASTTDQATADQTALNDETPAAGDASAPVEDKSVGAPVAATAPSEAMKDEAPKTKFVVDLKAALKDREVGSKDAPITVYDFSSLTCPHCAHFHNEIYPKVKENYIDKGKVRWVYRGFPLNEAALKADMVARCAPEDQYEKLIDLMFKNQERWSFTDDPIANLSMLVKVAGIDEDMFLACVNNKDLEFALAQAAQTAAAKYEISSTPTFVFNDGLKKFSGAGSYEGFAVDLDQLLKYLTTPAQSTSDKLAPAGGDAAKPALTKE